MNAISSPSVLLLAAAGLVNVAAAQHLVLPDSVNLGVVNSTTAVWRSTAGRFQIAYDTTHFTNAGVTGPVLLTHLRFRPRDGESNLGGQVYTGVTVEVGNCASDYASLGTTFAANRGTMGALGTANVVVQPAGGGVPNDYTVDIDLVAIGATFLYDPSTGNDLLVDISFPAPSPSANLPLFAAGSSTLATARARMCSTNTTGALTGALAAAPAMLVDFIGAGGYAAPQPARIERIGHGCGSTFQSFYQDWQVSETFDLANTSIMMLPNSVTAPTGYTVVSGTTAPDLTKLNVTPDSTADDAIVSHPLGFTFNYPSGSTTAIAACTNGYVWLDGAMTVADSTPAVTELLGWPTTPYTARLAPFWYNFHAGRNATTHPNSGLHVVTDTSGGPGNAVCYVTWFNVGRNDVQSAGMSASTFQCVLYEASGIMEMRFGSMQVGANLLGITGWSPGRVGGIQSAHPGPIDLSHELALPLVTQPDGGSTVHALSHGTSTMLRPILGSTITFQGNNMQAGSLAYLLCLDLAATQPAVPIPGLLSVGCGFSLTPNFLIYDSVVLPAAGTWSALPLQIPSTWPMGVQLFSQVVQLDFALVDIKTTNALKLTIGLN
jgi:hypothetical protein